PVAQADDASNGNDSGHGGSGRHAGHGNGRITERSATPATASPFAGDLFGRTPGSRASADDAADDHDDLSADEHDDHHGTDSDGPAPSARTRALAIRRSNAARAIFPANPMRPWRSPNA
ncbi:UNVERIFIED_CONTAM: TetR family transcriptional regulator, partial [Mumia flava]